MPNDQPHIFPPVRLVAQFADGSRHTFSGQTEGAAMAAMYAAQNRYGGISWYDGVTDLHYTNGQYYKLVPPPQHLPLVIVDVTDAQDPGSALRDPLVPEE